MDNTVLLPQAAASSLQTAAWAVLLLPLLSFLVNGLWLGRKHERAAGWAATALMGATLVCALVVASGWRGLVLQNPASYPSGTAMAWEHVWMSFGGNLSARLGFYLDPASVMMIVVVALVSFLVHFYSIGYMRGERGAGRFFALLSLFTFAMLGLIVSGNLIQTFFFWELVGAASYLLIGFWYAKPAAVAASKKAFVLTRFADAFFLMGVLITGLNTGSFDFLVVNGPAAAAELNRTVGTGLFATNLLTVATVLLYMGAWGKSAMFPFHVWLPDAMEGPTPVSALIHSATMVVAGVYLTARLFPLFAAAEHTLDLVAFTGALTAVFAAAVACTQTDLKRILAFSTLSQLGLMMLALGASAPVDGGATGPAGYTASLFHVFTHAFFKSLLFLSAGVIIHAIHSNDLRDAGGLRKKMPWTYASTLAACLALAGLWPFAGFFSKEEILGAALANGHFTYVAGGLLTGGLTAFYMTRYFVLVFHGAPRKHTSAHGSDHGTDHGHGPSEPVLMVLPLIVLTLPSVLIGWLGKKIFEHNMLSWSPGAAATVHAAAEHGGQHAGAHGGFSWLVVVATALALLGIGTGVYLYGRKRWTAGYPDGPAPWLYRVLHDKLYIDEIYTFLIRRVGSPLVITPTDWAERKVLNESFDQAGGILRKGARMLSRYQNGQVQLYMAIALLGLLLFAAFHALGF